MRNVSVSVGGTPKNIKNIYVSVNGTPKKILKGYVSVNGTPKQFWPPAHYTFYPWTNVRDGVDLGHHAIQTDTYLDMEVRAKFSSTTDTRRNDAGFSFNGQFDQYSNIKLKYDLENTSRYSWCDAVVQLLDKDGNDNNTHNNLCYDGTGMESSFPIFSGACTINLILNLGTPSNQYVHWRIYEIWLDDNQIFPC